MQAIAVLLLLVLMSACGAVRLPPAAMPVRVFGQGGPVPATGAACLWQDAAIFDAVRSALGAARSTVLVEMYEFGRADLRDALEVASRRGADVRVIYDPSVAVSIATASALQAAGVPVRPYPLDDRRHQIDHVKLLIADGVAVTGGMNWGAHSAANHDYAFELRAPPDVARLRAVFEQDWSLAGGHPAPLPLDSASAELQTAPGSEIRAALIGLLGQARSRVDAEVFALTDPEVLAGLAAAHRRGAAVRVLLDPGEQVNRPSERLLRRTGVAVRWYPVRPGSKLHAKAGLFDGTLLLGSANWSRGGLSINHELDVRTSEPALTAAFAARFERDWAAAAGLGLGG